MSGEHAVFDANPQSTMLEDGDRLVWYNWENGRHAVLGRDEIRPIRDRGNKLIKAEILNLGSGDLGYLRDNGYILPEKRDISYYRKALADYLESLDREAFMVFFPRRKQVQLQVQVLLREPR